MKIAVECMMPDSERSRDGDGRAGGATRRGASGGHRRSSRVAQTPIVRPLDEGTYEIIVGERQWREAIATGAGEVECTVREDLTTQETNELRLAEQYHTASIPPMKLGKAFMAYRETYDVTQQELARRTGITPGTIHHYESLIRTLDPELGRHVDSGKLTFKEARSIADISDFRRQAEIAQPFLSGRLSSVYVERIVGLAKSDPELAVEQIIDEVVNGKKASTPEPALTEEPEETGIFDTSRLEVTVLEIAGELDALQLQVVPEYRRLKLMSSLRILEARVSLALAFLNSGPAVDHEVARPMAGVGVTDRHAT